MQCMNQGSNMSNDNPQLQTISAQVNAYCDKHFRFEFIRNNPAVRLHEPSFGADEINAMIAQSLSTQVTMGRKVRAFEEESAKFFGTTYCVMNNSGSSANLVAIAALANPAWKNHMKPGFLGLRPFGRLFSIS